jgi:hypothetical protein
MLREAGAKPTAGVDVNASSDVVNGAIVDAGGGTSQSQQQVDAGSGPILFAIKLPPGLWETLNKAREDGKGKTTSTIAATASIVGSVVSSESATQSEPNHFLLSLPSSERLEVVRTLRGMASAKTSFGPAEFLVNNSAGPVLYFGSHEIPAHSVAIAYPGGCSTDYEALGGELRQRLVSGAFLKDKLSTGEAKACFDVDEHTLPRENIVFVDLRTRVQFF